MTDQSVAAVVPAGTASARGDAVDPDRHSRGGAPIAEPRPVGAGGVLDGAFDLLRARAGRLVALAACLYVPIRLLDLVTMITSGNVAERYQVGPSLLLIDGASAWSWVVLVLQSLALSVLGVSVGALVAGHLDGADLRFGDLVRVAARRGWVALVIVPLTFALRAVVSCIPLGFLVVDALVFTTSVVAGAESLGPWRALRRSIRMSRASLGAMLGVYLGGLLISQLLRFSFTTGPVLLASTFSTSDAVLTAVSQAGALVVLVAEPLTACIAAMAYLELRCRNEGLDLRLRIAQRFG